MLFFQSSGIQVNQEVKEAYIKIKTGKKIPFVIFRIKNEKEVVVEHVAEEGNKGKDYIPFHFHVMIVPEHENSTHSVALTSDLMFKAMGNGEICN